MDVSGVRCGILMLNPLITKKLFQGVVLELGAIVTSLLPRSLCQTCVELAWQNQWRWTSSCPWTWGRTPMCILSNHQQWLDHTSSHQDYPMMGARRDPHEGAPKALTLTRYSWVGALFDVASWLCMHYTHDLSQTKHWLVQRCVHTLRDLEDF